MNKTQNYQLNQWEAEDRVLRTDFNADNAKIDAALTALGQTLAGKTELVTGTYTGDGSASRSISIGFKPKVMLIFSVSSPQRSMVVIDGVPVSVKGESCQISSNYFRVYAESTGLYMSCSYEWSAAQKADAICNTSGTKYIYFALR